MALELELWYPESRPAYIIYNGDTNTLEEGPSLSADEVYCDLCNADVPLNPAPMVGGNVLCLECLSSFVPDREEQATPLLQRIWQMQMAKASE